MPANPHGHAKFLVEYLNLRLVPGTPETFLQKVLRRTIGLLIPKANPDFEEKYVQVVEWWLEIDDDNHVIREIGLDAGSIPIVGAPLGVNWGLFVDKDKRPPVLAGDLQGPTVEPAMFEKAWMQLEREWTATWRRR